MAVCQLWPDCFGTPCKVGCKRVLPQALETSQRIAAERQHVKTDHLHAQFLGMESAQPSRLLSTVIPGEVRALGNKAVEIADREYNRGFHKGFEAAEEAHNGELWWARAVGLIVGALGTTGIGALLVATKAVVIRLG